MQLTLISFSLTFLEFLTFKLVYDRRERLYNKAEVDIWRDKELEAHLSVVLVEHGVEGLVDAVQVKEYAGYAVFHLHYDIIDLFIHALLVMDVWVVAAIVISRTISASTGTRPR